MGWKMVLGKDPTTGLQGIKVDDINHFGKATSSFTVRFTVCEGGACDLSGWDAVAAYKAGQCVGYESVDIGTPMTSELVSVYPNPFNEKINFQWSAKNKTAKLDIMDHYGNLVSTSTHFENLDSGHKMILESSAYPNGMYYYRLTLDGKTYNGKINKR
jgi:hypothetical protein